MAETTDTAVNAADALPEFASPFRGGGNYQSLGIPPRTRLEMKIDSLTASVRDKLDWWRKVEVSDIVGKWKAEALDQGVDARTCDFAMQARTLLWRIWFASSKHAREKHDTTWRDL
jgi:hypothetical protein